jgi:hypothetical protein
MPADRSGVRRRSLMRATVRRIWATPSVAHAPGSVTTSAASAANNPFTVSSPSDGGQSMSTRS